MGRGSARKRTIKKAVTILVALALLIAMVEFANRLSSSKVLGELQAIAAESKNEQMDLFDQPISSEINQSTLAPEDFSEEVLDLCLYQNVRVLPEGGVVGFWDNEEVFRVQEKIKRSLIEKGWEEPSSSTPNLTSYVRYSGQYQWVLLYCSASAGGTSVVLYYQ